MSYECVLKCGKSCTPSDTISKTKWKSLREKNRIGLDWISMGISTIQLHGTRAETTFTCMSHATYMFHQAENLSRPKSVKLEMRVHLQQWRMKKQQIKPEQEKTIPAKRLCSSMSGPLHDKSKCVWCMKGEDPKHPTRAHGNSSELAHTLHGGLSNTTQSILRTKI